MKLFTRVLFITGVYKAFKPKQKKDLFAENAKSRQEFDHQQSFDLQDFTWSVCVMVTRGILHKAGLGFHQKPWIKPRVDRESLNQVLWIHLT